MPTQSGTQGTGLSYTSDGNQYGGGVEYVSLMNNTTAPIYRGQVVSVIWDTSVQSLGLGAVQLAVAATSAGSYYNGVALNTVAVVNATCTATFPAQNKVGGPQMVDVAIGGGPVLVNCSTAAVVAPPAYLFCSTSAPGLAVSTGSIGATSVGGFGGPGSSFGVLVSTAIQGTIASTSFQNLVVGMVGKA